MYLTDDSLNHSQVQTLKASPGLPAGLSHVGLANTTLWLLALHKATPTYENTTVRSDTANIIATLAKHYNTQFVLNTIATDKAAELAMFMASYGKRKLTRSVSSVADDLQKLIVLLNPQGNTLNELLQLTCTSAGLTPIADTTTKLGNMRTLARPKGLRRAVSVVVRGEEGIKDAPSRAGASIAQPIHPHTGLCMYETAAGFGLDIHGAPLHRSPLYMFHARSWGRVLYAEELHKLEYIKCPFTNLNLEQLRQGGRLHYGLPPSTSAGGWWYLYEAEQRVRQLKAAPTNDKLVLPYYEVTEWRVDALPSDASAQLKAELLQTVILRKVGIDGDFGEGRNYLSGVITGSPSSTNAAMLQRIINDDKVAFGMEPHLSVAEQMNVLAQNNLDAAASYDSYASSIVKVDSGHTDAQQQLIDSIEHLPMEIDNPAAPPNNIVPLTNLPLDAKTIERDEARGKIAELKARFKAQAETPLEAARRRKLEADAALAELDD